MDVDKYAKLLYRMCKNYSNSKFYAINKDSVKSKKCWRVYRETRNKLLVWNERKITIDDYQMFQFDSANHRDVVQVAARTLEEAKEIALFYEQSRIYPMPESLAHNAVWPHTKTLREFFFEKMYPFQMQETMLWRDTNGVVHSDEPLEFLFYLIESEKGGN